MTKRIHMNEVVVYSQKKGHAKSKLEEEVKHLAELKAVVKKLEKPKAVVKRLDKPKAVVNQLTDKV